MCQLLWTPGQAPRRTRSASSAAGYISPCRYAEADWLGGYPSDEAPERVGARTRQRTYLDRMLFQRHQTSWSKCSETSTTIRHIP